MRLPCPIVFFVFIPLLNGLHGSRYRGVGCRQAHDRVLGANTIECSGSRILLSIRLGKVESGISTQKMSARDFWRLNHHCHGTGVLNSLLDCNRKYLHL
jgi:hypothetical protein